MESVENRGVFGTSVRKTVENSGESVEKGLVEGCILGGKSGKFMGQKKLKKRKKSPRRAVANCTKNN